ncbi:MAG: OsmC family protein [Xanthomonadales bacterium]|nr:OsmC family protein [Xanthomonadales bacterium]
MTAVNIETNNGVNIDALLDAREALTEMPPAAQFQWRASSEWVNGTHTRSTVEKFFGLGEEQSHKTQFSYDTDHPEIFASEDHGSTPVELILVGLSGCIGAGIATVAANRQIKLNSVKATVEADMDLAGILGIDPDVRNGFSGIRVKYEIDADASEDDIKAIVAQSQKRSAVFDIVTNPTDVEVQVSKA